jgi:ribosomal 50S subunit-associated protein YjgA (DUF615 family)
MCSRIKCTQCDKPSYAGCGAHIEQVLGDVPKDERCKCRERKREAKKEGSAEKPGLLSRLFGR